MTESPNPTSAEDQWRVVDEGWGRQAVAFATLAEPAITGSHTEVVVHGDVLPDVRRFGEGGEGDGLAPPALVDDSPLVLGGRRVRTLRQGVRRPMGSRQRSPEIGLDPGSRAVRKGHVERGRHRGPSASLPTGRRG